MYRYNISISRRIYNIIPPRNMNILIIANNNSFAMVLQGTVIIFGCGKDNNKKIIQILIWT